MNKQKHIDASANAFRVKRLIYYRLDDMLKSGATNIAEIVTSITNSERVLRDEEEGLTDGFRWMLRSPSGAEHEYRIDFDNHAGIMRFTPANARTASLLFVAPDMDVNEVCRAFCFEMVNTLSGATHAPTRWESTIMEECSW